MGTLNRAKETAICLRSLLKQKFKDFEVIIIDQSTDEETRKLAYGAEFGGLNIIYKHVDFRGLSRARNAGLALASGRYFALIDDDAGYDENYLLNAHKLLENDSKTILSGYIYNNFQKKVMKEYLTTKNGSVMSVRKIMRMAPSPALIYPMEIYRQGIKFDEEFGVGAKYGACEETDVILTALDSGYRVRYCADMIVEHPTIVHSFEVENTTSLKKKENYAYGLGALLAKDKLCRGSGRLAGYEFEKKLKCSIKKTGFFGNGRKQQAVSELRGLNRGKKEYGEKIK